MARIASDLLGEEVRMLCEASPSFKRFWSTRFNMPKGYASHEDWKHIVAPFVGLAARVLGLSDLPWRPGQRLWEGVSRMDDQAYEAWWTTSAVAHQSVAQDGPFYVVGPDLLATLRRAKNPPVRWALQDIEPPYSATTFFLPVEGNEMAAVISVCILTADQLRDKFRVRRSSGRTTMLLQVFSEDYKLAYHGNVEADDDGMFDLNQLMLPLADKYIDHLGAVSLKTNIEDAERLLKAASMACSLLVMLRDEHDYVEKEMQVKVAKLRPPFTDIPKTTIMNPKKLGFNATLTKYVRSHKDVRTPSGEPRRTMDTHWRAPHWHTIRFGKGRNNSRVKWFPPIQVNPPEKEDPIHHK